MRTGTNGTLLAIQNMTWNGLQGLQSYPNKTLYVPYHAEYNGAALASAGELGLWGSERGLTFYQVQLSGHGKRFWTLFQEPSDIQQNFPSMHLELRIECSRSYLVACRTLATPLISLRRRETSAVLVLFTDDMRRTSEQDHTDRRSFARTSSVAKVCPTNPTPSIFTIASGDFRILFMV